LALPPDRSVSWGEQKKPRHRGGDGLQVGDLSSMIPGTRQRVISFSCAAIADAEAHDRFRRRPVGA